MKKILILGLMIIPMAFIWGETNLGIFSPALQSASVRFYLNNTGYYFQNGDLRNTDNTSYTTVQFSDDNFLLACIEAGVTMNFQVLDCIKIAADISKPGYWGNDSLQVYNTGLAAKALNFDVDIARALTGKNDFNLDLSVGRQRYYISSNENYRNYILSDILDAVVLKGFMSSTGLGCDIVADLFSMNSSNYSQAGVNNTRGGNTVPYFNGDVNIIRFFVVPQYKIQPDSGLLRMLEIKPYVMFGRIGATGYGNYNSGGYEVSGMGMYGNYADNDWLGVGGLDGYVSLGGFSLFFEAAYSIGIDRKFAPKPDVNISGYLAHLYLSQNFGFIGLDWLKLSVEGEYASGGDTDPNGNYTNYGFVSMKGDNVGGYLFRNYYAAYPSAIMGCGGIWNDPFGLNRTAPTASASLKLEMNRLDLVTMKNGTNGLYIAGECWLYQDTGHTSYDTNTPQSPWVYDQDRFGKFMGIEIDGAISYAFFQGSLEVGAEGGVFIPYDFYLLPVSIKNAPYGIENFIGMDVYTKLRF